MAAHLEPTHRRTAAKALSRWAKRRVPSPLQLFAIIKIGCDWPRKLKVDYGQQNGSIAALEVAGPIVGCAENVAAVMPALLDYGPSASRGLRLRPRFRARNTCALEVVIVRSSTARIPMWRTLLAYKFGSSWRRLTPSTRMGKLIADQLCDSGS
jgi:hypothetical protein